MSCVVAILQKYNFGRQEEQDDMFADVAKLYEAETLAPLNKIQQLKR